MLFNTSLLLALQRLACIPASLSSGSESSILSCGQFRLCLPGRSGLADVDVPGDGAVHANGGAGGRTGVQGGAGGGIETIGTQVDTAGMNVTGGFHWNALRLFLEF